MKRGKGRRRGVTIVVHADGDLESKQYRLPRWAVLVGKWGAGAIAVSVVLFFAFAGPITRSAARVPGLEREVSRLRVENSRVQRLAAALNRAEANYQELRQMLGVKAPPVTRSGGTVARTTTLATTMRAVPIRAARPGGGSRFETGESRGSAHEARCVRELSTSPIPASTSPSRWGPPSGHRGAVR